MSADICSENGRCVIGRCVAALPSGQPRQLVQFHGDGSVELGEPLPHWETADGTGVLEIAPGLFVLPDGTLLRRVG
jgi:hypothetical protein